MHKVAFSGYVPGAIGRVTELHGIYYSGQWGFSLFFESRVATELSEFLSRFQEKRDGFWVALVDRKIVGSIAIDGLEAETKGARLRWFIVSPEYQGRGIGNSLLQKALEFCRGAKFSHIHLSTFAGLDPARHLYEKWGFSLQKEYEGDQWGRVVTEQVFQLDL